MSLGNTSRVWVWVIQAGARDASKSRVSSLSKSLFHLLRVDGIDIGSQSLEFHIFDAVRFWCNLAWVGHISQAYLDYIGWPSNITRQMKVWRNSKRTQLNKENLSLVANFSCLLFEVLHSVSKGWCFSLRAALVPDQSAARGVSVNFEVVKIVAKSCKRGAAQRLLQLRFSACTWSRRGPLSIYLFFNIVLLNINFFSRMAKSII